MLVQLETVKDNSRKLMCWFLRLYEFDFTLQNASGKVNVLADVLSRNIISSTDIKGNGADNPSQMVGGGRRQGIDVAGNRRNSAG